MRLGKLVEKLLATSLVATIWTLYIKQAFTSWLIANGVTGQFTITLLDYFMLGLLVYLVNHDILRRVRV